jgi:hypothetical protein
MQNQKQCIAWYNSDLTKQQNLRILGHNLISVSKSFIISQQGLAENIEQHKRLSQNCMSANKQCVTLGVQLQKEKVQQDKQEERQQVEKASERQKSMLKKLNVKFISTLQKIMPQSTEVNFVTLRHILDAHVSDMSKQHADEYNTIIRKATEEVSAISKRGEAKLRNLKGLNASASLTLHDSAATFSVTGRKGEVEENAGQEPEAIPEVDMQDFPVFKQQQEIQENFKPQQEIQEIITDRDRFLHTIGRFITEPDGVQLDEGGLKRYNPSTPWSYFGIVQGETRPSVRLLNHLTSITWYMLHTYFGHALDAKVVDKPSPEVLRLLVGMYITSSGDSEAEKRILPWMLPELFFAGPITAASYAKLQRAIFLVHQKNLNRMPNCVLGSEIYSQLGPDGLQRFSELKDCTATALTPEGTAECVTNFSASLNQLDRTKIKEMFSVILGGSKRVKREREEEWEAFPERAFYPNLEGHSKWTTGETQTALRTALLTKPALHVGLDAYATRLEVLDANMKEVPIDRQRMDSLGSQIGETYGQYTSALYQYLQKKGDNPDFDFDMTRDEYFKMKSIFDKVRGHNVPLSQEREIEELLEEF